MELLEPGVSVERKEEIRAELTAYCERDSEAMFHVVGAFREF